MLMLILISKTSYNPQYDSHPRRSSNEIVYFFWIKFRC